jgi:hypothetical protein
MSQEYFSFLIIVWCCQFKCDVTVWRSLKFLLHFFSLYKDTKSSWTNKCLLPSLLTVSKNYMYIMDMMFSFLNDRLTFQICIVMKLFCELISFLWNRVINSWKVLQKCCYVIKYPMNCNWYILVLLKKIRWIVSSSLMSQMCTILHLLHVAYLKNFWPESIMSRHL